MDFYHLCDYLSAAAQAVETRAVARQQWLQTQKDHLKTGRLDDVLNELQAHLEPPATIEENAPVRRCHRYLSNRLDHLDYESALRKGLPIGSGEIESAHRYIVQKRLKLPGSWWTPDNAEHMLALRVSRANHEWNSYWATNYRYAA